MAAKTPIQWCDTTVNPTTGCDGCELFVFGRGGPCYAGAYHERRMAKALPELYAPEFTEVRLAPGRMRKAAALPDLRGERRPAKPWLDGLPRLIFVSDMSDALSAAVPFEYLKEEVIASIDSPAGRRHEWLWLTKRPARMAELSRWLGGLPENLWIGTSVTGRAQLGRIAELLAVPAVLHFASLEPLVEPVDLYQIRCTEALDAEGATYYNALAGRSYWGDGEFGVSGPSLGLVIAGGESNQGRHRARPFDLGWARSIRDDCREARVPFFLKQLGSNPYSERYDDARRHTVILPQILRDSHGGDWSEWPEDLRVRQMPIPAMAPAGS